MGQLTCKSLQRLAAVFMALAAISSTVAFVAVLYLSFNLNQIKQEKATLLSQNTLQEQLLQGQPLAQTVYPHAIKDISYVLNPFVGKS